MLRGFFALVVAFLYAPIVILLIFSFNDSDVPTFPLCGFTLHWYRQFLHNSDLQRRARDVRDRRRAVEPRRGRARDPRLDRADPAALPLKAGASRRSSSARS